VFAASRDPIADLAKRIRRLCIGSRERPAQHFRGDPNGRFLITTKHEHSVQFAGQPTMSVHSRWSLLAGSKTGATFVASMV
jgi:hypothetical protein